MCIMSTRMVASTSATVSQIPTGAFISIEYSKFIQNYWWLRSPDTIGPSYVKNVHRNGAVMGNTDGSVIDSYGRKKIAVHA